MSTEQDLVDFKHDHLSTTGSYMRQICPACKVAMTVRHSDPETFDMNDFVCSDLQFRSDTYRYPNRDCGIVNAEWEANPSVDSAPCCNDSELFDLSFAMMAQDRVSEKRINETARAELDYVLEYIHDHVLHDHHYIQILISRDERMIGFNYNAAILTEWAPGQIVPSIERWSYRFDIPYSKVWLQGISVTCNMVSFLLDIYGRLIVCLTCAEARQHLMNYSFLLLVLPSTGLPLATWPAAYYLSKSGQTWFVSMVELFLLARLLYSGKQFLFKRLLKTLAYAVKPISSLITVLLPMFLILSCVYSQLYGVAHIATYAEAITMTFDDFAKGTVLEGHELDTHKATGYVLHFVTALVLYLTLSQIFITLLMQAFDDAKGAVVDPARFRNPDGYISTQAPHGRLTNVLNEAAHAVCGHMPMYGWVLSGSLLRSLLHQEAARLNMGERRPIVIKTDELALTRRHLNEVVLWRGLIRDFGLRLVNVPETGASGLKLPLESGEVPSSIVKASDMETVAGLQDRAPLLGRYVLDRVARISTKASPSSEQVGELEPGTEVRVVEALFIDRERGWRGRIECPAGWISLTDIDGSFCCAHHVLEEGLTQEGIMLACGAPGMDTIEDHGKKPWPSQGLRPSQPRSSGMDTIEDLHKAVQAAALDLRSRRKKLSREELQQLAGDSAQLGQLLSAALLPGGAEIYCDAFGNLNQLTTI